MTPLQTPTLVRWGRVVVVAAVAATAVWVFASLPSGQEIDSGAFLDRAVTRVTEVRSFHATSKGTVTMSNGDVHHWSSEGASVYTGDSRLHIRYEGCTLPTGKDVYLCSTEWVVFGGVSYRKEDTSECPGEWEVMDDASSPDPNTGMPYDPAKALEDFTQRYDLLELRRESIDGVVYRRFWGEYNRSKMALERLKAGEWEPPKAIEGIEISREDMISSFERQAEAETGTIKLWAREDDSTMWRIITERDNLDVDASERFRSSTPRKTYDVLEYSRYNEPVVIKRPI